MSSSDKTKLDGIATGATKVIVDSTLSSTSTNPVQNKVIKSALDNKLDKLTYEWNKSISFGNSGYLKIGEFTMYDTNITIDIDSTANTTYHATVVIATQNVSSSSIGSVHVVNVYGDASNTITPNIRVVWNSGSNIYTVYFVPSAWSKNLIHIRAIGLNAATVESTICASMTGTAPTSTPGLEAKNMLKTNYADISHTHSIATSSSAGFVKSSTTGTTANRDYNVQVNADGTMKVNVPWTDVGGDGGGITCTLIFEGAGDINGYYTQTLSDGDYKILLFEVNVNNVYFYLSVPTYNSKYSPSTFYLVAGNTNNGSIGIVEITSSNTNFSATVSNGDIVIDNVNVYAYK